MSPSPSKDTATKSRDSRPANTTTKSGIHTTSGRSAYGFGLVLLACVIWGFFPIAAKGITGQLDPHTINFYRFAIAGLMLLPFLLVRGTLPRLSEKGSSHHNLRLVFCALLLIINYFFYIIGVQHITPSATQILIQFSTVMLLLAGVFFFGERLSQRQWLGCLIFLAGLVVFFYPRIVAMLDGFNDYALGMGLISLAAICWTGYAVLQKQLLLHFSSSQIMLIVYLLGALVFLPLAQPLSIIELDTSGLLLLFFCGASTLVGSGSFSEAMAHIEASKASALLSTLPVFTILFMWCLSFIPGFAITPEPISNLTLSGAALVVFGALMVALKKHG
ncbi:MAG: DMT family transporter [Porticoccaceae bacterium]|nr:DMT family transporter [Porticoccaceae bacterium]